MHNTHLLIVGLAKLGTGFTRVLTTLADNLSNQYKIHYFGLSKNQAPPIVSNNFHFYHCPYKVDNPKTIVDIEKIITQFKHPIVFFLGQPWYYNPLLKKLEQYRNNLIIVNYTPFEGYITNVNAVKPLRFVDQCILYTEFARQNLLAVGDQLKKEDDEFRLPQLHVLPHGVVTQTFFPILGDVSRFFIGKRRFCIREEIFPDNPELHNAFIVLNANYPYYRKRIDLTIKGFALFARDKPSNVYLYLHHPGIDRYKKNKLYELAKNEGIGERLKINAINKCGEIINDQQLNCLYNACDVGINTAMGEGWGLVSFEHAATGAAQLVPNHTTFTENWSGAAELIEVEGHEYLINEYSNVYHVLPEDIAEKLNKLYSNDQYLHYLSLAAYQHVLRPQYDWKVISRQLSNIFNNL